VAVKKKKALHTCIVCGLPSALRQQADARLLGTFKVKKGKTLPAQSGAVVAKWLNDQGVEVCGRSVARHRDFHLRPVKEVAIRRAAEQVAGVELDPTVVARVVREAAPKNALEKLVDRVAADVRTLDKWDRLLYSTARKIQKRLGTEKRSPTMPEAAFMVQGANVAQKLALARSRVLRGDRPTAPGSTLGGGLKEMVEAFKQEMPAIPGDLPVPADDDQEAGGVTVENAKGERVGSAPPARVSPVDAKPAGPGVEQPPDFDPDADPFATFREKYGTGEQGAAPAPVGEVVAPPPKSGPGRTQASTAPGAAFSAWNVEEGESAAQ
jgi:hypothetical protein